MNTSEVDRVADAILYEGYLLYPYRRSSVKNRSRWTYGGVYPGDYVGARDGSDAPLMQTECLLRRREETALHLRMRFLQLVERSHEEAIERHVVADMAVAALLERPHVIAFEYLAQHDHQHIRGQVELLGQRIEPNLVRLTVRITNLTPLANPHMSRHDVLKHTLVSTHTILQLHDGEFVSLLDPPDDCRAAAQECQNVGTWPVLAGAEGATDTMLSSPIILYDYPRVAPESPGDLFDATEIDEILTLRILTLTDAEKQEMAATDDRARLLLARTEALAREQLMGLHGTVRGLRRLPEEEHP